MAFGFIFFIFGLTVSAKEEDLQTESTNFIITMPSEEQNISSDNAGEVSTESPARLTVDVITSPGTDLFHTPHESQHSSTVNATTTTDKYAITSNGQSFVLAYGTGSRSTGNAGSATQSEGDLSLISDDEERLHPSAEAGFESMMNDTMMPAAHLSRGKEKIPAFFHASLESKNQRVLESITPSPTNGIPMVSASDPAVIDNLGESSETVERRGENNNENWTLKSLRADDPLNHPEEALLNKNYSTIMRFTVLQGTELLTTELGQNPRNRSEHEPKEQKNLLSASSLIPDTPLQVKPTSQVIVNKMTESSKNPSANGPKPFGVSLKQPDSMFLFSASKSTPAKIPEATPLNYVSNTVTAAGEMHVTKQFAASRLISDSMHRIVSARDRLESKSIFHTKSSKERQIKPTLQSSPTSSHHRLNESDLSLPTQNSSSFLKTSDLCTEEVRTSNVSVKETHNRTDHFPVWLSEMIAFSTASFTNAEEATDNQIFVKQTQSSLAARRTLSPPEDTSKRSDRFDESSTAAPVSPLTKLKTVFHVFKVNDHQSQQTQSHSLPERLKPFVLVEARELIPPSFTSATAKRFANMEELTKFDSTNQNQQPSVSQKVQPIIFERLKTNSSSLTKHEMLSATTNSETSHFIPTTHQTLVSNISTTKTFITTSILKPFVSFANISLFTRTVPQKTSFLLSTAFSKSQYSMTTDDKFLSKLLSISKKSNSEYIFLNHSVTTGKIGLPLDDRQQDLKNAGETVMQLFGSSTISSVPSVQRLTEAHPGEAFVTETPQSQSRLQIESYLKKRDDTGKPTKLKPHDRSVVGVNQTSLTSISHNIVSHPIHSSISPIVHSNHEFKQHLTFSASPSVSIERETTKKSEQDNNKESLLSHRIKVKEHAWDVPSNRISFINKHTTLAGPRPEGVLNESPLKSSTATTSPFFPLQMKNVLDTENLTLTENQTEFFSVVNEHSETTQTNIPADEMSSSGTTEDVQNHLGRTALSAVTGQTFAPVVHTDLSFSSTETQTLPKGSLQSGRGTEDVSHDTTAFAGSDSTEFVSDMPAIKRKRRVISPDSLSGLAQISDDICGTGNYTAEMSLNLERDIMPGDLIPALGNLRVIISLKTNNSQVNLEIKSCCLSPSVRLDEFNTTCCIFSRLPIDPHGIRLLPSVLSKRASFTISLFQMINYSTAYLHCDLSVCLRNHSECERQCAQRRNAHLQEETGARMGNRISFGPVFKEADNSSFSGTADDTEAVVVIISSVAGCLLACLALSIVWMANRRCLQRSAYCWSRALCEC